jgi:DNA-binding HxlR family transcriptional regulator
MPRREYGQECSFATALDTVGERWSLLIVRELLLGPLRFSDLARLVGGAPTDVLTKRLRDLEEDGVVRRRDLDPPASARVYELTELGRGLEQPLVAMGRWGMRLQRLSDVLELPASLLPSAVRAILQPPADAALTIGLRSEGDASHVRIEGGTASARRGEAVDPDIVLAGPPLNVLAVLVGGTALEDEVEIEGDRGLLELLRAMVAIPRRLREEAMEAFGTGTAAGARVGAP